MKHSSILVGGLRVIFSEEDALIVKSNSWKLSRNYARQSKGRGMLMHRMILGVSDSRFIDHIDGNTLNNTRENLRICTHAENMRNRKIHANNQSGFKGVYKRGKCWVAQIRANGIKKHLGSFQVIEEAHTAYCEAAKELHGAFFRAK